MIELGLERISQLLANTPLPWRAIHVAGTNGKGSICAYVSGMLEGYNNSRYRKDTGQSRIKHARYNSPHLIDRWDCITIDQKTVPFSLFREVEKKVLQRNQQEAIQASEFEILTATAFELFTQEEVDVGVIEVGMGGRLDATNILGQPLSEQASENSPERAQPLVTAIAKIGLDHQGFLGDTLEDIAREKAGIMKPGVPLVHDESNPKEIRDLFGQRARSTRVTDVPLVTLSDYSLPWSQIRPPWRVLPPQELGFVYGMAQQQAWLTACAPYHEHKRNNASVAFRCAWTALSGLGCISTSSDNKWQDALAELANDMLTVPLETVFPGRQQWISVEAATGRKKNALLDGAHNAQSAAVLAQAVDKIRSNSTIHSPHDATVTFLLAASDTKDVKEILRPLLKTGDKVVAVEFGAVDGMPWVKPMRAGFILQAASDLGLSTGEETSSDSGNDVLAGLKRASQVANEGPLVIAGSLYLVGDVLRLLREFEEARGNA